MSRFLRDTCLWGPSLPRSNQFGLIATSHETVIARIAEPLLVNTYLRLNLGTSRATNVVNDGLFVLVATGFSAATAGKHADEVEL